MIFWYVLIIGLSSPSNGAFVVPTNISRSSPLVVFIAFGSSFFKRFGSVCTDKGNTFNFKLNTGVKNSRTELRTRNNMRVAVLTSNFKGRLLKQWKLSGNPTYPIEINLNFLHITTAKYCCFKGLFNYKGGAVA